MKTLDGWVTVVALLEPDLTDWFSDSQDCALHSSLFYFSCLDCSWELEFPPRVDEGIQDPAVFQVWGSVSPPGLASVCSLLCAPSQGARAKCAANVRFPPASHLAREALQNRNSLCQHSPQMVARSDEVMSSVWEAQSRGIHSQEQVIAAPTAHFSPNIYCQHEHQARSWCAVLSLIWGAPPCHPAQWAFCCSAASKNSFLLLVCVFRAFNPWVFWGKHSAYVFDLLTLNLPEVSFVKSILCLGNLCCLRVFFFFF